MSHGPTPTELKLRAIVAERLKVDPRHISLDRPLLDALGLDSLDVMSVIAQIEEAFAPIVISDRSAAELGTLRKLGALIDAQEKGSGKVAG